MADFLSGLGNAAGMFATGVGQVLTGNFGGAIKTAQQNPYASPVKTSSPTVSPPKPSPAPAPTSSYQMDPGVAAQIAAMDRQTAALKAQMDAQPKLIYRDTNAAWQDAQNKAATSVNPVYADNLNRKIKELTDLRNQQTANTQAAKTASDTTLTQTNEDIATNRQRTAEDTASAIAQNQQQEGNWQTQEGTQANAQEEAARLALGDQGIMGRGAGQLDEAKIQRNQASDQQTQSFANERDTKQLLATRTFQDLNTKGTRATEFNVTQKADLDRTLNDFITNQENEKNQFIAGNEADRLNALFQGTQQQYQTDTAAWLANLAKGGARAQDVALATQIYGR